MRLADLRPQMRIRAIFDLPNCWRKGDEFIVYRAGTDGFAIECGGTKLGHGVHKLSDAVLGAFETMTEEVRSP